MLRTIIKILLALFALVILGVVGVYLYLKFSPKKSITISGDNIIAKNIIKNAIPDLKSCTQDSDCNWYVENQGKPPGSEEPDRLRFYCDNSLIQKQCKNCSVLPESDRIEALGSDSLCQCLNTKCSSVDQVTPLLMSQPSTPAESVDSEPLQ